MLKRILLPFLTFGFLLISLTGRAQEKKEFYNGVRGLGMGGVQIATVNDETALLVNPAALGKLRDAFFTIADPEIEWGEKTEAIVGVDAWAATDPQDTLDLLNSGNANKYLRQRIQVFPSLVLPNFGIGVYGKFETSAILDDTTNPGFRYDYTNDFAAVIGYNFRIWDGRIKLGFNVRATNRIQIDGTYDQTRTDLTTEGLAKEGFGVGSDVGLIMTAPWALLPTLALVYRDAGATRYNLQDGMFHNTTERPDATDPTLDIGMGLFPIFGKKTRFAFALEYRDALSDDPVDKEDTMRRAHAGIELNLYDAFFIRAGWHQRYYTAGLELAMFNYQLQFATYGEEIGTSSTNTVEDRRYVGKFSFRF